MIELLFFIGAIRLILISGNVVQSRFLKLEYESNVTECIQSFFVGLFLFLFINFLALQYFSDYLRLPWFEIFQAFVIIYLIGSSIFQIRHTVRLRNTAKRFKTFALSLSNSEKLLILFILFFWFMVSLLYVYENDALEYFGISRQILSDDSLKSYPPIRTNWTESLYAPSTHPPYFHILFALFAPSYGSLIGLRLILLCMCVGMVLILLDRSHYNHGFLVATSLPILIFGIQGLSIESFRLPFFASGLVILLQSKRNVEFYRLFMRSSLSFGMMISTHSLGLLMSLLSLFAMLVVFREIRTSTIHALALLASIACVAPQYIYNTLRFGSPIQDSSPILDLPQIAFYEDLKIRRQISTLPDMLINGSLRPILDYSLFGFIFTAGLTLSLMHLLKNFRILSQTPLLSISATIIVLFTLLQIGSSIFGIELLVKNVRYGLSIFPCILFVLVEKMKLKIDE